MSRSCQQRIPRVCIVLVAFAFGVVGQLAATAGEPPSWIFRKSQFSHDPMTGARVAQYSRVPPVEPLPDPRLVTSGYRRTRTNLRGPDGSIDSYYNVSSYNNGRGGLDAEWERFHDAWLQSYTAGGYFYSPYSQPLNALPHYGYGYQNGPYPLAPPAYGFPVR